MGSAPPPELEQFVIDREMFRELGWTDGIPSGERPWRQVDDYMLFISMYRREEQARARARR